MEGTAMSTEDSIYVLLNHVMVEVGHVGKDARNPQGGYNFRGIDAVVNAVAPALRKYGVFVAPQVVEYHYGEILVGKNRTPMGHARVVVAYTFYGPAGDSIATSAPGEAFDSGDKATPKAMSVAFRTALLQSLALPTDEPDPDSQAYARADHQAPPPDVDQETGEVRMIDKGQLIKLKTLESKLGKGGKDETPEERASRMNWYEWAIGRKVTSSNDLTQREAEMVIAELRKRVPAES